MSGCYYCGSLSGNRKAPGGETVCNACVEAWRPALKVTPASPGAYDPTEATPGLFGDVSWGTYDTIQRYATPDELFKLISQNALRYPAPKPTMFGVSTLSGNALGGTRP